MFRHRNYTFLLGSIFLLMRLTICQNECNFVLFIIRTYLNWLKHTFIIFLMLALLAQHFSRVVVLADYMANMERYKKDCVNKAKPMLHCNGKCQVKKKLEAHDNEEKRSASSPKLAELDFVLSSKSFFPDIFDLVELYSTPQVAYHSDFTSAYTRAIFHPPSFLS